MFFAGLNTEPKTRWRSPRDSRPSQSDRPKGLKKTIKGSFDALANVHSLFVQSRWTGAELGTPVKLSPYSKVGEISGLMDQPPEARSGTGDSGLATNTAKYGALPGNQSLSHARTMISHRSRRGVPEKPHVPQAFNHSLHHTGTKTLARGRIDVPTSSLGPVQRSTSCSFGSPAGW